MPKKICPDLSPAPICDNELSTVSNRRVHDDVIQYTPPALKETKAGSYIEYYAFDPAICNLRRKRIKINRIKGTVNRRKYAKEVIERLWIKLYHGWNPWIKSNTEDYDLFQDGIERYETYVEKMFSTGCFRKETYAGYKSNLKILKEYVETKNKIYYMYQFDREFCSDFLDHIFIDRDNGAQTRNNYLNFLRVLSGFFVEKGLLDKRPTDGIAPIPKKLYKKERECIPLETVAKIGEWCRANDPHFHLACLLLYYCMIRPVEMTRLRVRHFNLHKSIVKLPAEITKNKTTQTITVPKKVIFYALDLGIFNKPMDTLIFSDGLLPGYSPIDPKIFRDHWDKMRKALGLKKEWKFYSLKDTGITAMCDAKVASIAVKDQARHSSLAVTEVYLNHDRDADPEILEMDGAL